MAVVVTVDEEGRIALPREVREHLGLALGDKLLLEEAGDRLVLTRASESSPLVRGGRRLFKPAPPDMPSRSSDVWNDTPDAVRLRRARLAGVGDPLNQFRIRGQEGDPEDGLAILDQLDVTHGTDAAKLY